MITFPALANNVRRVLAGTDERAVGDADGWEPFFEFELDFMLDAFPVAEDLEREELGRAGVFSTP